MITDEQLDFLQRIADGATPGPWKRKDLYYVVAWERGGREVCEANAACDAHLIAAARDAVPALVAEVRRLRSSDEPTDFMVRRSGTETIEIALADDPDELLVIAGAAEARRVAAAILRVADEMEARRG